MAHVHLDVHSQEMPASRCFIGIPSRPDSNGTPDATISQEKVCVDTRKATHNHRCYMHTLKRSAIPGHTPADAAKCTQRCNLSLDKPLSYRSKNLHIGSMRRKSPPIFSCSVLVLVLALSQSCRGAIALEDQRNWGNRMLVNSTATPSEMITERPSSEPSARPTLLPSKSPTVSPSDRPTLSPSDAPTMFPSKSPSKIPTAFPSKSPSKMPTTIPSILPTNIPSVIPSIQPSKVPSSIPSPIPSLVPSMSPTVSQIPSELPSFNPSYQPSLFASSVPSIVPTSTPSLTLQPSESPSVSQFPSTPPSSSPSLEPSGLPTSQPSLSPSTNPTLTSEPSASPTSRPSGSKFPSAMPTVTTKPSFIPTFEPSLEPSSEPTISIQPSTIPTAIPSDSPTLSQAPSSYPSSSQQPTFQTESQRKSTFQQTIYTNTPFIQDDTFIAIFENVMASFTSEITNENTDRIITKCDFTKGQEIVRNMRGRRLEEAQGTVVTYTMEFISNHTDVQTFDKWLRNWINTGVNVTTSSNTFIVQSLVEAGFDATIVREVVVFELTSPPTDKPTLAPSDKPTSEPSKSPSTSPSGMPSLRPSDSPSLIPSSKPTANPSLVPSISSSELPSTSPSVEPPKKRNVAIAAVFGTVGVGALLFFFGFCVRRRSNAREDDGPRSPLSRLMRVGLRSPRNNVPVPANRDSAILFPVGAPNGNGVVVNDPEADAVSMSSENSLISTGSSRENNESDSDIEFNDETYNLADEFDQYKDQNLEKMRSEVGGMSSNFDGMMSQALTKALMDDMDDEDGAMDEMTIDDPPSSMDIEATVLCDINDWIKKKEGASGATAEERREFMQETLNEMVSKVRRGLLSPEDASRTIHGSAAMLGLELAETLPETTLIVTGMRKQVTKEHVVKAFKEFGELDGAAVSSKQRGFGVVRYRSPKSVQNAIDRFRYGEIVVQDVGVMIRVLKAHNTGDVERGRRRAGARQIKQTKP